MPWKIKIIKTYKCYPQIYIWCLTELYLVQLLIQKYVLNNTHYIASKNALFNLISLVCPESCCPCHFPASTLLGKAIIDWILLKYLLFHNHYSWNLAHTYQKYESNTNYYPTQLHHTHHCYNHKPGQFISPNKT